MVVVVAAFVVVARFVVDGAVVVRFGVVVAFGVVVVFDGAVVVLFVVVVAAESAVDVFDVDFAVVVLVVVAGFVVVRSVVVTAVDGAVVERGVAGATVASEVRVVVVVVVFDRFFDVLVATVTSTSSPRTSASVAREPFDTVAPAMAAAVGTSTVASRYGLPTTSLPGTAVTTSARSVVGSGASTTPGYVGGATYARSAEPYAGDHGPTTRAWSRAATGRPGVTAQTG